MTNKTKTSWFKIRSCCVSCVACTNSQSLMYVTVCVFVVMCVSVIVYVWVTFNIAALIVNVTHGNKTLLLCSFIIFHCSLLVSYSFLWFLLCFICFIFVFNVLYCYAFIMTFLFYLFCLLFFPFLLSLHLFAGRS